MFDQILSSAIKCAVATASGVGGLFLATAEIADDRIFGLSVTSLRDVGSFGLVTLFVLGILWGIRTGVPAFLQFLRETRDGFLAELKCEREMREKNMDAFREMLGSHKNDLGGKLTEVRDSINTGNDLTGELVKELRSRPCQK